MKKISIFYQVFLFIIISFMLFIAGLYLLVNQLIPRLYQQVIENDMSTVIDDVNSIQSINPNTVAFVLNNYSQESAYKIQVYNALGEGIYMSEGQNLTVQTVIDVNQETITGIFFDGNRQYYTRIQKQGEWIIQTSFDVEGFYQLIDVINQLWIYIGIFSIGIAIILSYLVSKSITHPIIKLTTSVLNHDKIEPTDKKNEIAILRNAIFQYQQEISLVMDTLDVELTREKAQDKLTKTFIANASHEIQTPLSIIYIAVETLEEHLKDMTSDFSLLNTIKAEIRHLEHLTKDMMVLSKNRHQLLELSKGSYDLYRMLTETKEDMQLLYPDMVMTIDDSVQGISVEVDYTKFKQVLFNIINNACIHQKQTQSVDIKLNQYAHHIKLSIHNPNSHINEEDLPHLFDTFYKSQSRGSGLGLAIVKTILESHQMTYHIYNDSDGVTFDIIWSIL